MKVIAILSGGLDSTVLAHELNADGELLACISVNYGQRHRCELKFSSKTCELLGVEHVIADLSALRPLFKGSSQTDDAVAVPHGHYAAETMKLTVVPNRNMLLLATAAALAISRKADAVAYGAHAGDHAIYPDCRPEFTDAIGEALMLCDWHPVKLLRPYIGITKADIVRRGALLGIDFRQTWSCYEGDGESHCGKCGTCTERREAFQLAGVVDPTEYRG